MNARRSHRHRHPGAIAALALLTLTVWCAPASPASAQAGRDVSFPQCGMNLPSSDAAGFGVVGVNGGASFSRNGCLAAQLGWAKTLELPPAFYANTGNPGPWRSHHWPLGQTAPWTCPRSDPNALGCSYDYGWNAGVDAFEKAMDGAQALHHYDRATAHQRVANVDWWLDVEILNSWQTLDPQLGATRASGERDTAALVGQIAALRGEGVQRVGVYSTNYQWNAITGGPKITRGRFTANPAWLAGFDGHADAVTGCGFRSFTGGPVLMTQYLGPDGFDADVWCW